jgi:hypothetical protein
VPYSVFEGNYNFGATLDTNDVDRRSLDHAKFGIKINNAINSDSLVVRSMITAQENITNDFVVHIVAVERHISAGNFQWVMARMLPNAAGTFFSQDFITGDSVYLQQTWKFSAGEVSNPAELGVVVFIQDLITHEIYQTVHKQGSGNSGGVVLGLDDPESGLKVHVYPNPSSESSFVLFNKKVTEDYDWEVYDQLGKLVDSGKLRKGSEGFALNTSTYPPAMYVVKIGNGKELLHTKMLVVH